jgi:hypothetical protein
LSNLRAKLHFSFKSLISLHNYAVVGSFLAVVVHRLTILGISQHSGTWVRVSPAQILVQSPAIAFFRQHGFSGWIDRFVDDMVFTPAFPCAFQ